MEINKILIANRGEIAVRISRAARELGIQTLAVYSDIDGPEAYHCRMADNAIPLKGRELSETYLDIEKLIKLAKENDAQAVHPGYGFLSENHLFARACEENGIAFIGPGSELIRVMGNKIEARGRVAELGVPVINADLSSRKELLEKSSELEYPLLIKAAAGGGGKGMRIVQGAGELSSALETTSREADNYFGNGDIFLEKYIDPARHIEFQVMGDHHGNAVHVYERECSIQRRYQKIIEESPSQWLAEETRKKMAEAALRITTKLGYTSAGTIEFLVDENQDFYFLEMNTRIQVEHPVTEGVSGLDLVKEQIRIAMGLPLSVSQEDIRIRGHAIEARIYAEDPCNEFMPSPGEVVLYLEPDDENVRMDSSLDRPGNIFPEYDPMISKMIVWGRDRHEAVQHLGRALEETGILGIDNNITFLQEILKDKNFIDNHISTSYCDDNLKILTSRIRARIEESDRLLYMTAFLAGTLLTSRDYFPKDSEVNPWKAIGFWRQNNLFRFRMDGEPMQIKIESSVQGFLKFRFEDSEFQISKVRYNEGKLGYLLNGNPMKAVYARKPDGSEIVSNKGINHVFKRWDSLPDEPAGMDSDDQTEQNDSMIVSPMYGKIVKVNFKENEEVKKGDVILTIDSMKIENNILAPRNARIEKLLVEPGDQVQVNRPLLMIN